MELGSRQDNVWFAHYRADPSWEECLDFVHTGVAEAIRQLEHSLRQPV